MDLLPQNMNEWMRGVKRDLSEQKRHRHPSLSGEIAALRARVEALEDDTGWLQLGDATIGDWSNFTMWRRIGDAVWVRLWLRWDGDSENQSGLTIGTLPEDARPTERMWQPLYSSSGGSDGMVRRADVTTGGVAQMNAPADGNVSPGNTVTGSVSFPRG